MLSLVRIDDRLIHGQVATQWVANVSANTIVIIDDETANDEFTTMVCKGMAPLHVEVFVCTTAEAGEKLRELDEDSSRRTIVLVKTPGVLLQLMENGVNMKKIIVGGIGKRADRKIFYKSIHVSDREIEDLNKIIYVFLTIFLYLLKCPQSLILSALRAFCFCGK
ncbi:MAG: PTS sugar transporter subunit IIB, partial [Hungatella hathewayi]|nr:PTS sugar transporter subunit IIB [Hungatella hathewayi]